MKLKSLYVIQKIQTKEYLSIYRGTYSFSTNIFDAISYKNEEDALKEFNNEFNKELFENSIFEIKKYYFAEHEN